jgi:hypothetical protein
LGNWSIVSRRVVTAILKLREEGLGYLAIANRLNEDREPGPAGGTSRWSPTKVRRVVMREQAKA